jgi:sugar lactone lactonase YvrE
MLRFFSVVGALAVTVVAFAVVAAAAQGPYPQVIKLPKGFQPEGIAIGKGGTFYVGSIPTGAVFRGNLRTGTGDVLVRAAAGRAAIGVELDNRSRLFVAGGDTGKAFVYNGKSGALIREYTLTTAPTFINDVVVTKDGAYFTDSQKAALFRVPIGSGGRLGTTVQTVQLSGDYQHQSGFNVNGIDATSNGKTLVVVQSNTGKLFRVNPQTGAATLIALGGESVPNGDGLLLTGKTLYVVQNRNNQVAVIALSSNLASGRVVTRLTDPDFDVPTTMDDFGRRLYAVNARFGTSDPSTADYAVVQFRKSNGR